MKTKEELQKIIADAQSQLAEMEKHFELPIGQFFISNDLCNIDDCRVAFGKHRIIGLVRPTREQAENARQRIIRYSRLLALRDALDDGTKQEYTIAYSGGKYDCWHGINIAGHAVFFGCESAKKACELLNSGGFVL